MTLELHQPQGPFLLRASAQSAAAELEEDEFRLDRLPNKAKEQFAKGADSWRDAVAAAIAGGIRDPDVLADMIFFMRHPERMKAGVGQALGAGEADFVRLRAEWILCRTIATGLQGSIVRPGVFLPANPSGDYEDYVAAPTTGRIGVNGK